MAWKRHAIAQTQLRKARRVDGVGRPKFDFHTGLTFLSYGLEKAFGEGDPEDDGGFRL